MVVQVIDILVNLDGEFNQGNHTAAVGTKTWILTADSARREIQTIQQFDISNVYVIVMTF